MPAIKTGIFYERKEMNLHFKNMPPRGLPYSNTNTAMSTIIKLYEDIPFLPLLQNVDINDDTLNITLSNLPCFVREKDAVKFINNGSKYENFVKKVEETYLNPSSENLNSFKSNSVFIDRYFKSVKRIKPNETIFRLYGPFSFLYILKNLDFAQALFDKNFRKTFIQMYFLKALWFIKNIRNLSPSTIPIVIFEEPMLNKFGILKRNNESIDNDLLIDLYTKLFDKIHSEECLICVECFEKCDWQIPINSNVDIISFNAFEHPHNLNIIAPTINTYLKKGGLINWGIVPLYNERTIAHLDSESVYYRFVDTIEDLIKKGVNRDFAYKNALVSTIENINSSLPLIQTEKGLILANKLAYRLN